MNDYSIGSDLMNVAQNYADKYPTDNATYFYPRSGLQYQVRYSEWIDMRYKNCIKLYKLV